MAKKKLNKADIPEMDLGGWLKENRQGVMGGLTAAAGIGTMFIPGLQGVGAGMIASGVGGITKEIQQDQLAAQNPTVGSTMSTPATAPTFKFGGKYRRMANGGLVEWQGGEPLMTPGGKIVRTPKSMPSHKQGGVVGEVEEGTAFLGQMKNPETGNKYMVDGDKLGKIQAKADKILGTSKTSRSRNAAILNKKNASMKFDAWVAQQEMLKPKSKQTGIPKAQSGMVYDGPPTMSMEEYMQHQQGSDNFGTDMSPFIQRPQEQMGQYERWQSVIPRGPQGQQGQSFDYRPTGGQLPPNQYRTLNGNDQTVGVPADTVSVPGVRAAGSQTPAATVQGGEPPRIDRLPLETQDFTAGIPQDTIDPMAPGQGTGVIGNQGTNGGGFGDFMGQHGSTFASLAPVAYNAISGLLGTDQERLPNQYNQANSLLANRRFNIRPFLRQNRITQQIGDYNAKSRGGGGTFAQRQTNMAGRMGADMQAEAMRQQMDNQYMAEQARGLFGTGQAQRQVDEANLMNKAARRNMIGTSLSQFSNFAQNRELMNNQGQRDDERLQILARTLPMMYNRHYADIYN